MGDLRNAKYLTGSSHTIKISVYLTFLEKNTAVTSNQINDDVIGHCV